MEQNDQQKNNFNFMNLKILLNKEPLSVHLISLLLQKGKKAKVQKVVFEFLMQCEKQFNVDVFEFLYYIFFINKPYFNLTNKFIGKKLVKVPYSLSLTKQYNLLLRLLVRFSRKNFQKNFSFTLLNEFINLVNKQGSFVKYLDDLNKLTETNRVFLYSNKLKKTNFR